MKHLTKVLLLLGCFGAGNEAKGAPMPAHLVAGPDAVSLAGHVAVVREEGGPWTLDDVRTAAIADRFVTSADTTINQAFTDDVFWYRVALQNPAGPGQDIDWVLELKCPWLDYVDLFIARKDGSVETIRTGDLRQPPPAQISHASFAIPLRIAADEELTVYARVQTRDAHQVALMVWTPGGFQAKAAAENLLYGLCLGCLLVMALYNLVIYLLLRDRAYLYYVLYIMAATTNIFFTDGLARQFGNGLSPSAPAWLDATTPYLLFSVGLFAGLFAMEFLQTRRNAPRLHQVLRGLVLMHVVGLTLIPLVPANTSIQVGLLLIMLGPLYLLGVAVYLSLKGVRAARFYVLAWCVIIVSVALYVLASFGILPFNVLTENGWQIGACLDVMLLSVALGDRINQERKEKFAERENATRLKSFLPEKVADLVLADADKHLLEPKRRQVTVCVIDLRGFTPFSETSAPEDVMKVLREFYSAMGEVVEKYGGTVEHFAGDSILVFFNAPLEMPGPELQAVQTALEMRTAFMALRTKWSKQGHELGLGIGIADGFATIGAIGFSGRSQYAAIGAVTNLAARLCSNAEHGEILTTARILAAVSSSVESQALGEQAIKGFHKPVQVVRLLGLSAREAPDSPALASVAVARG